ncbi:MAG: DUF1853 family protein [Neisseria sp.]|uniref:DUF1853 family protein n=1 Tax=Neisseria sp. TaxID=192066 RepID=UPI0026DADA87|nr:DUF1853 family protein [Neisseria sp.]MDO4640391.1 DUF1853 family protein [Neisseria sp.]
MNYALDALWWRLVDKDVRALASLLTAPALWETGCELPVRLLLGEEGFRYLLRLDQSPEPLHRHLADEAPFGNRLGRYAESLLAFWFHNAPHAELLTRNLPVTENGQRAGELDLVVRLGGVLYHIELTCKYYGAATASPDEMVGLNRSDRLADKAAKLAVQLALPYTPAGTAALQAVGIPMAGMQSASIVHGIGFAGPNQTFNAKPLNPYGWHGRYLAAGEPLPFEDDVVFYILPRMDLLAPARVELAQCCGKASIDAAENILFAVMEKRPDGLWHENFRLMKPAMQL